MSNGTAIQTGEAFIRFFGDISEINKAMDDIASRGARWAAKFTAPKTAVDAVTLSVKQSGAAAEQFSAKANAALASTNAQFSATSAAANQTAVAVQTVGVSANSTGSVTASAMTPQVANFIRLGVAALSASANLSRMLFPIGKMSQLFGYFAVYAANIGKIGRAAGLAAQFLGFISKELRQSGINTAGIDRIGAALQRVSNHARFMGLTFTLSLLPLRTLTATASLLGRGASALGGLAMRGARAGYGVASGGMATGRLARGASLANIGAMSAGTGEDGKHPAALPHQGHWRVSCWAVSQEPPSSVWA